MGFFFLLAGYFTPASLERKGYARFICDRFLRLGLPLLAFGLLLGPLTAAIVNAAQGDGFWVVFPWLWRHRQFINGPLWFAQAHLLIFSLGLLRHGARLAEARRLQTGRTHAAKPGSGLPLVVAERTRLWARLHWRFGNSFPSAKMCSDFSSPTSPGCIASPFAARHCRMAPRLAAAAGLEECAALGIRLLPHARGRPCLPVGILILSTRRSNCGGGKTNFAGGLSGPAALYALWDPFVAWGLIAAWLLLFRAHMNQPSAFWTWLNRRAYAVYIIHPPVLVGIALLLHGWAAPALVKFGVVGALACIGTWLIADPFVRLPGFQRVV